MLLFAISGGMLIAGGQDLLLLFIGLELLVLPGYMLAGFAKRDGLSTEGAIKYFLLGSFSSAIFLFGLVFLFGYTGTTQVHAISDALTALVADAPTFPLALAMGLALLAIGVSFKIAAVPFHYWTPDAYQGSPTPVTGYLSVGPKVAAFALILRLFVEALGPLADEWALVVILVSIVTMTRGQPRRPRPGQHQADAGVLLDRAHGLHPRRPGGLRVRRQSRDASRRASRACSSTASRTRS